MNKKELIALLKNWQVALLIILVIASAFLILPRIEDGKPTTNLHYGLDLSDGTWLQMEFQSEVVGFQTDRPVGEFLTDLQKKIDAEIVLVEDDKIDGMITFRDLVSYLLPEISYVGYRNY